MNGNTVKKIRGRSHGQRQFGHKKEKGFRATGEDGTTTTIYRSGQDAYVRNIYGIPEKLPISYKRARENLAKKQRFPSFVNRCPNKAGA